MLLDRLRLGRSRVATPITPLRLFADRDRIFSYLARLVLVGGMFGMFFFLTQFLQDVLRYSPLQSGLAFLPLTAALVRGLTAECQGAVGHAFGPKRLMVGGLTFSTLGLLMLTQLSPVEQLPAGPGRAAVLRDGQRPGVCAADVGALAGVDPADAGAASGLVNVMQQVGGALGLSVLVTVFGTASRAANHHAVASSAAHTFVYAADRAFFAAALMLMLAVALVANMRTQRRPAGRCPRPCASWSR